MSIPFLSENAMEKTYRKKKMRLLGSVTTLLWRTNGMHSDDGFFVLKK